LHTQPPLRREIEMRTRIALALATLVATTTTLGASVARANEHHFAFTYESSTLPAGTGEIEPWTTFRAGRQSHFVEFDNRLEFEGGITDRLQTSLYFNFGGVSLGDGADRTDTFLFQGISSEWKYRVLDSVADAIGLAFYGELGASPSEAELELKLILDKRIGPWLFALNLVLEPELEFSGAGTGLDFHADLDVGAAYFITPQLSLGLELRNQNTVSDHEGFEYSVLYAGPTLSFSTRRWWMTVSATPQLPAFYGATPTDVRNFTDHEVINARALLGFHL
jgi:hypothetical protein